MTEPKHEEGRQTKPFADVLARLQRGKTHRELSAAMQQLTEAVVATGRAGSLTLTIKVTKGKAGHMVELDDSVKVKLPEAERETSLFFVTDDHNLVRDDPRQLELPVGPVRVADASEERTAK